MAESSRTTLDGTLLNRTLPLVPGLVQQLETGIDVVDVGCGAGVAILLMASGFREPVHRHRHVAGGYREGHRRCRGAGLTNARFLAQDAASFDAQSAFDFITAFDAIHDQAAPRRVLRAIRDALRPDGVFLMVDIATSSHLERDLDSPMAPFLYTVSTMHCMTVSLAQGGEGLGAGWGEGKHAGCSPRRDPVGRGLDRRGRSAQPLLRLPAWLISPARFADEALEKGTASRREAVADLEALGAAKSFSCRTRRLNGDTSAPACRASARDTTPG